MTNVSRLQNLRVAIDQIVNDETRVECACVLASGEQNANVTLGWDDGATEDWSALGFFLPSCVKLPNLPAWPN